MHELGHSAAGHSPPNTSIHVWNSTILCLAPDRLMVLPDACPAALLQPIHCCDVMCALKSCACSRAVVLVVAAVPDMCGLQQHNDVHCHELCDQQAHLAALLAACAVVAQHTKQLCTHACKAHVHIANQLCASSAVHVAHTCQEGLGL